MFKKSIAALFCLSIGLLLAGPLSQATLKAQQDSKLPGGFLPLLPENTSFFSINYNLKEACDTLINSKAWAKLKDLNVTKMIKAKMDEAFEGAKASDENFEKKQAVAMKVLNALAKLASHELVVAGGPNTADSISTLMNAANAGRMAPLTDLLQGKFNTDPKEKSQAQIRAMIESLGEDADKLQVPEILVAFGLKGSKVGEEVMGFLEKNMDKVGKGPAKISAKKEKIQGSDFITVTIKGAELPLDDLDIPDLDEELEKKLKAKLKKLSVVAAIGIHKDYLVFTTGPNTKFLASLGQGKSVTSVKEIQVLGKHAGKKITDISYVSKKFISSFQSTNQDLNELSKDLFEQLKAANLPKELTTRLEKDMKNLFKDFEKYIPKPGAFVGIGFNTKDGCESLLYNYASNTYLDSSKALGLLENMGGNPILAAVMRGKVDESAASLGIKWAKVAYGYFKDFGLPNIPGDDKEKVEAFLKKAEPIFSSLAKTTETLLNPAMKDGQIGLVLDGKITSKQWSPMMPKSKKELPMLELGLFFGLADSEKFTKAISEYREGLNKLIKAGAELDPSGMLGVYKIPTPATKEIAGAKSYYFPIPDLGLVDNRLQPGAVVGKDFSAFTLSFEHAERLLKKTPLGSAAAKLAGANKNASGFLLYDNTEFLKFLSAWIGYGLDQMPPGLDEALGIRSQVKTVLDVLGTCKGIASITYEEDGITVSRTVNIWKDLE